MQTVDQNRVRVWQALSTLFLDTESDDATFSHTARVVLETGYSRPEIHNILWGEVFPVLKANLRSIAGEWAGWPDEWLLEHLRPCEKAVSMPRGMIAREIDRCWKEVENRLLPDWNHEQKRDIDA
ncbi:hypothetical protein [Bordetella muralis]|jgi:hypothetical protein|uniref:DUF7079 family protein n=1 Tax=Bordetella muralis TaxID=1649130 RepID=UPI0039EEEDB3